jgi:hypothetical protein
VNNNVEEKKQTVCDDEVQSTLGSTKLIHEAIITRSTYRQLTINNTTPVRLGHAINDPNSG